MALTNYHLASPSEVILEDLRDPYVSWQHHLDRTGGLRGGVDIVADIGTPVIARTSGTLYRIPDNGSAGNSCEFAHDANPGYRDVFSHLSSYAGPTGAHFNAGEVVAYTGNTGGVPAHLHWHLLNPAGARVNPWDYFSSTEPTPTPILSGDRMIRIQATNRGIALIGAGYYRQLNTTEEVEQSGAIIEKHITGNDRQFDLWVAMALHGQSAKPQP